MKDRELTHRCLCPCNKELSDHYKGRQKIFYSSLCRKIWHELNPGKVAGDVAYAKYGKK